MTELYATPLGLTYWLCLLLLVAARGLDFLSTWVATPSLLLEANPIARAMGWRLGLALNALLCLVAAAMPFVAVLVSVTSVMVAARNFQAAWLARTMGEYEFRDHLREQFRRADKRLVLGCVWAQAVLYCVIGGTVVALAGEIMVQAIGWGIVGFGLAVAVHSTHYYRRVRHVLSDEERVSKFSESR
ncbi:MAG: hypothetical protein FJ388_26130 [Verrucomicrobia bacterium]|nr:hypothetical protein [Verrucomicrobiota bacterium]